MKDYLKAAVVTAGCDVRADASIPSNTNQETAAKARSKSKRHHKTYRAIQRPDSVVIERPRYRPADLDQKSGTKADGDRPGSRNVILARGTKEERSTSLNYDLLGIESSASGTLNGDNGGFAAEEGTYMAAHVQETTRGVTDIEGQQYGMASTPMDRFLCEHGPWGSCCLRGQRKASF